MVVIQATATGRSHLQRNIACQDNIDVRIIDDGLIFAVADGAGSAAFAREGSELAVRVFCDSITRMISSFHSKDFVHEAFREVRRSLEKDAADRDRDIASLHTTLLGVVYYKGALKCAAVGDTICFVENHNGFFTIPLQPTKGEFVNETIFVTSDQWQDYLVSSDAIERPTSVFACSDGLINILYSLALKDSQWQVIPHDDVINKMKDHFLSNQATIDLSKDTAEMLQSEKANKLNDDDKSIVAAIFTENYSGFKECE